MAKTKKKKQTKAVLFLHVTPATKRFFKSLCRNQKTPVSQSTMAERILSEVKLRPRDFTTV